MTNKQKLAIAVASGLLGTYAIIFVYQRIKRKKADESVVSSDEAFEVLNKLKSESDTPEPYFSEDDTLDVPDIVASNTDLTDLQEFESQTGMGDY